MTLVEAVKNGELRIQNNHRHMFWDGEAWVVQKKFRGRITLISRTSSEELAINDLLFIKEKSSE